MDACYSLDALRDLACGRAAPDEVLRLYRQAFADYGTRALWSWRALERPSLAQALAIADALRIEGDVAARRLALRLEEACRAAL